jgi:hypothetical protein
MTEISLIAHPSKVDLRRISRNLKRPTKVTRIVKARAAGSISLENAPTKAEEFSYSTHSLR